MLSTKLSGLLIAALLSAYTDFSNPNYYVEPLRPNLYFGLQLAAQTNAAFIRFATTDPPPQQQPRMLRVLTWANEGGNRFDGSLGYRELDSPVERNKLLLWAANVTPPSGLFGGFSEFDKLVVELNPYMYTVAHSTVSLGGNFATVDAMGAGVIEFGEWIDAILQWFVECRGDIGQTVPCHGLNHVIFPKLEVAYSPTTYNQADRAMAQDQQLEVYLSSVSNELYIAKTSIGWLYRAPAPGEFSKLKPIDAYPTYGPFDTPEEAARDAADRLNLRPSILWEPVGDEQMSAELRDADTPRLHRALHEAINLRAR